MSSRYIHFVGFSLTMRVIFLFDRLFEVLFTIYFLNSRVGEIFCWIQERAKLISFKILFYYVLLLFKDGKCNHKYYIRIYWHTYTLCIGRYVFIRSNIFMEHFKQSKYDENYKLLIIVKYDRILNIFVKRLAAFQTNKRWNYLTWLQNYHKY